MIAIVPNCTAVLFYVLKDLLYLKPEMLEMLMFLSH